MDDALDSIIHMKKRNLFKYFDPSEETFYLEAMLFLRFPLSRRNIEDSLYERSMNIRRQNIR